MRRHIRTPERKRQLEQQRTKQAEILGARDKSFRGTSDDVRRFMDHFDWLKIPFDVVQCHIGGTGARLSAENLKWLVGTHVVHEEFPEVRCQVIASAYVDGNSNDLYIYISPMGPGPLPAKYYRFPIKRLICVD